MSDPVYGIYYYSNSWSGSDVNVFLCAICSSLDKAIEITRDKFCNFERNINNSLRCKGKKDSKIYVIWINKYELDVKHNSNGLACNQPNNSVNVESLLI